jgi:hypothetical protein
MDLDEFRRSTGGSAPPDGLAAPLTALWHAAKGDWKRAHEIVQDAAGKDAAWVHAYLHRVEGDLDNAGYWYRQAGRPAATTPLDEEWNTIATAFLAER